MSVAYKKAGEKAFTTYPDEPREQAYQVSASGVLQLLENDASRWIVIEEISAGAWDSVYGTRFIGSTEEFDGKNGSKRMPRGGRLTSF